MKIFVQVIDEKTGIYSGGMIDEPVKSGLEIDNAITHFGVLPSEIEWLSSHSANSQIKNKYGIVTGTTKVVSVIIILKRLCPTNLPAKIGESIGDCLQFLTKLNALKGMSRKLCTSIWDYRLPVVQIFIIFKNYFEF